jgi:hypothetical protein
MLNAIKGMSWCHTALITVSRLGQTSLRSSRLQRASDLLLRQRHDFSCLYLIIKRVPALMMFSLEYAVDADMIAIS